MLSRVLLLGAAIATAACGAAPHREPREAPTRPRPVPAPEATPKEHVEVTPPPETTREKPLPPLDAAWGTEAPIAFVAASHRRNWVAFCQARHDTNGDGKVTLELGAQGELRGDRLEGYFADSPGEGIPIDAFGGADPSGRHVAVVIGGRLVVRDTATGVDTFLEADLRDDQGTFLHPRYVAFDPTGTRMLYLRMASGRSSVVVRELASGAESFIDPGEGDLYRADFDPTGRSVIIRLVAGDTNGDGRIEWPVRKTPGPWMRCVGPLPRYPVWERPGDDPVFRVASVEGGPARDAPGLVIPLGDALVERAEDGSLELHGGDRRTPLVKKACESRVVHADGTRGMLVVTCAKKKTGRSELLLVSRAATKPLGLEVSAAAGDHWFDGQPKLVPLYPGADAVLLDLGRGEFERLGPGDRVLATEGDRALVLRGRTLVFHEPGGKETRLPGTVLPLARLVRSGSVVAVPPLVVDVATGALLGKTNARVLAVAFDGSALVPAGRPADAEGVAVGPLRWEAPLPCDPSPAEAARPP